MFYRRMFEYVAMIPDLKQRFRRLFEPEKAWLAVHASTYEWPVDLDPFPLDQPPYDMCLRGYEVPLRYLRETRIGGRRRDGDVHRGRRLCQRFTIHGGAIRGSQPTPNTHSVLLRCSTGFKSSRCCRPCVPGWCATYLMRLDTKTPAWGHDGWYDGRPPKSATQARGAGYEGLQTSGLSPAKAWALIFSIFR